MGKSAGSAPAAPDPAVTIPLQTAANKETFDYATNASRVNQYTPYGSVTWSRSGGTPGSFDQAGYDAAMQAYNSQPQPQQQDPYASWDTSGIPGGWGYHPSDSYSQDYYAPAPTREQFTTAGTPGGTWEQTTSLSPEQQRLYDANVASQLQQSQLLGKAGNNVAAQMGQPIDYSKLAQNGQLGQYSLNTGLASLPQFSQFTGGQNQSAPTSQSLQQGAMPDTPDTAAARYTLQQYNPLSMQAPGGVNTGSQIAGPQAASQGNYNLTPQERISAPGATAGSVSAPGVTAQMGSVDPSGKVAGPANSIQDRASPLLQALQQYQSQLGGIDPLQFNQQAADASYNQQTRYLDQQSQQQQQALESRLAEQGFVPGTPGYKQAMQNFMDTNNRTYADARDRATLQGSQVGQNASNTSMAAIQAQIAAAMGGANFGLNNDQSFANERLNQANFASGQNAQDFSQRLANAQFGANRQDAQFSQGMQGAQFNAQQNNDLFNQQMQGANFNAAQGANDFQQRLAGANFGANRSDTAFNQGLQGAQFASGEQQNQFARDLANQQNMFTQGLAANNFNAGQLQQGFANQNTAANLGMTQDQNAFGRNLQAAQLGTQQQGQDFAQQQAMAAQQRQQGLDANQVAQQLFQNSQSTTQANNANQQQAFQNQAAQLAQGNATTAQQQAMDVQSAQYQNQLRQQQLAELLQQRAQPLNELNALRSGMQVQAPTGNGQAQTPGMQSPDVLGAYNNNYQGQLNSYNAQVGSQNSLYSGLASLAPMLALYMSDIRLKTDIRYLRKTARGHNVYTYTIFGRPGFGVLAQEVAMTDPSAVHRHPSGFLMVDYSKV